MTEAMAIKILLGLLAGTLSALLAIVSYFGKKVHEQLLEIIKLVALHELRITRLEEIP